jgi:hypothetical protein
MSTDPSSATGAAPSTFLPPDVFDRTTLLSLFSTIALVLTAYALSLWALPRGGTASSSSSSTKVTATTRFFFIWHAADALCHFLLEGSFLYHCFFSSRPAAEVQAELLLAEKLSSSSSSLAPLPLWPTPLNWLNRGVEHSAQYVYGAQAGGSDPFSQLWMVYARADRRWAGVDLGVVSIELLTVLVEGPMALYVCYCLSKQDPKVYIWMIIMATAEIYGGFMTFCPEWLTGNLSLDGSNFMYLYLYLAFFNLLWVFIPFYVIWVSACEISDALYQRTVKQKTG